MQQRVSVALLWYRGVGVGCGGVAVCRQGCMVRVSMFVWVQAPDHFAGFDLDRMRNQKEVNPGHELCRQQQPRHQGGKNTLSTATDAACRRTAICQDRDHPPAVVAHLLMGSEVPSPSNALGFGSGFVVFGQCPAPWVRSASSGSSWLPCAHDRTAQSRATTNTSWLLAANPVGTQCFSGGIGQASKQRACLWSMRTSADETDRAVSTRVSRAEFGEAVECC
jgi:hypothetical protein